jgi:hypothetical protein
MLMFSRRQSTVVFAPRYEDVFVCPAFTEEVAVEMDNVWLVSMLWLGSALILSQVSKWIVSGSPIRVLAVIRPRRRR